MVIDLGGRGPVTEGVVAADLALHAGLVSIADLRAYAEKVMPLYQSAKAGGNSSAGK